MPRGGDRRGLRLTDGRDLRLASLLLQAMCTDKTTNGKKFLSEFKSLYESKHRRIIKGLAHHKPDGRNRFPQSPARLAERLGQVSAPFAQRYGPDDENLLCSSRRLHLNDYRDDVRRLCVDWRLDAWWAEAFVVSSHLRRERSGQDGSFDPGRDGFIRCARGCWALHPSD